MNKREIGFWEAADIELEFVGRAMKKADDIASSDPEKYKDFKPEKAYPALVERAMRKVEESDSPEDLAHNLVHLAACAKAYFTWFVASVAIVEDDVEGQNAPGGGGLS